jgi:hypothetical protein
MSNSTCTLSNFKMQCLPQCSFTDSRTSVNSEMISVMLTDTAIPGDLETNPSFIITDRILFTVPFNSLIDQVGHKLSLLPNGTIQVNKAGFYEVSYSVAWNTVQWTSSDPRDIGPSDGYRASQIVSSDVIDFPNAYGSTAFNIDNSGFTIPFTFNGSMTGLFTEGSIISLKVFTTIDVSDSFTSLVTSIQTATPGSVTRMIVKEIL